MALGEPFCISYHGVKRAAVKRGEKVLVVGAGTIGVFAAVAAKAAGAQVYISDVAEDKLCLLYTSCSGRNGQEYFTLDLRSGFL